MKSRQKGNDQEPIQSSFPLVFNVHALFKFFFPPFERTPPSSIYTPGMHLCRGVYSFRLSIRMFVRSSVRNFIPFVELLQSFMLKQIKWSISHQPLTRKHSYLDHWYLGGSAFIPCLLTQGFMPRGEARGQNLGHV